MIERAISTAAVYIPWPSYINERPSAGVRLSEHSFCENKCTKRECKTFRGQIGGLTCHLGLTYYQIKKEDLTIITYGVNNPDGQSHSSYPALKKMNKGRNVTWEEFLSWTNTLVSLKKELKKIEDEILGQVLHPLHDTIRLAGEVQQVAEQLVSQDKTKSFEDNFDLASRELKALYKAAGLLLDTFDTVSIYFNPEAAKYGSPRNVDLYKLLDKLRTIVNLADASKLHKRIRFDGHAYKSFSVYESFKIIPLSFLLNAVKYSQVEDIVLRIDENDKGTKVTVKSEGPLIQEDECKLIFERGYRGKWASKSKVDGMGVGLYVARLVAEAHGIELHAESVPQNFEVKGIPQANNTFWFVIRNN